MIVLGIDGGLTGGIALLEAGDHPRVIWAGNIPVFGHGAKRRVDVPRVLKILHPYKIRAGFIERAQAFSKQGASSGFIYGRAVGALEACIMGMGIPFNAVESTAWQRTHGLLKPKDVDAEEWKPGKKKRSLARARAEFPEAAEFMPLEGDHGIAESILIAAHGLKILQAPVASSSPHTKRSRQLDLLVDGNAESR
jgi:hypothetical protein